MVLVQEPLHVLAVVAIIVVGKSLAAAGLVLVLRYPLNTALTVAASLGQIGEFSFILAGMGLSLGLLPQEGMSLVLAGALISIALNPFVFRAIPPLTRWVLAHSATVRGLEGREDPNAGLPASTDARYLQGQVVLVGHGRVGKRLAQAMLERNIPFVVIEHQRERVDQLRRQGLAAVFGDADDPAVLVQAHVATAAMLVVATPDTVGVRRMVELSRTLNPNIEVVLRTHNEEESELLQNDGFGTVFFGEEELARGMTRHVLQRFDRQPA
jgi:CPA2 family monovalent cation:H+ antiporter-2